MNNSNTNWIKSRYFIQSLLFLFVILFFQNCITKRKSPYPYNLDATSCGEPYNLPSGFAVGVYPNCFENIERLGWWTYGDSTLSSSDSPTPHFQNLSKGSISKKDKNIHLYVVTHGWAPGLATAVQNSNHNIKWWSQNAKGSDTNTWTSNWFWTPTSASGITVSNNGLIQEIITYERAQFPNDSVVVLAYSWVDDSATPPLDLEDPDDWFEVRLSEAHTNINGIRLAKAIQDVVDSKFFSDSGNKLHLLGHSHGTKVATTATLYLQNAGIQVNHLSIFDSPENASEITDLLNPAYENAANLLGYYFKDIKIDSSGNGANGAAFVDNYLSEFSATYSGNNNLNKIVNVGLNTDVLFDFDSFASKHSYSGQWYAGSYSQPRSLGVTPVGMVWPPVPNNLSPNAYQNWSSVNEKDQWSLAAGAIGNAGFPNNNYTISTAAVSGFSKDGNVSGSLSSGLVMSSTLDQQEVTTAQFSGYVANNGDPDLYGLGFEMKWDSPMNGGYFVVTVEGSSFEYEVFLVIDAKTMENQAMDWHKLSFNTSFDYDNVDFVFYYFPAEGNLNGKITIKNLEGIYLN